MTATGIYDFNPNFKLILFVLNNNILGIHFV